MTLRLPFPVSLSPLCPAWPQLAVVVWYIRLHVLDECACGVNDAACLFHEVTQVARLGTPEEIHIYQLGLRVPVEHPLAHPTIQNVDDFKTK